MHRKCAYTHVKMWGWSTLLDNRDWAGPHEKGEWTGSTLTHHAPSLEEENMRFHTGKRREPKVGIQLPLPYRTLPRRPTQVHTLWKSLEQSAAWLLGIGKRWRRGGAQSKQCSGLGKWHFCSYPCLSKDPGQQIWPFAELSRWPLLTRELRW